MSIGPPIPEIQHFQNLTLKIQGQGHEWGESWKPQHGSNILSTHIPFIPCQSAIPFLRYDFFKIWPWKSKVNAMVEVRFFHIDPLLCRSICHAPWPQVNPIVHPTSYPTHIPFIPSESNLPLLSYSNFHILPWKSKVKVMGEVKVWSHNVSLTFYRLTSLSFHFNGPSHSCDTTFSKFDLENPRSRSWLRWKFKVTKWV